MDSNLACFKIILCCDDMSSLLPLQGHYIMSQGHLRKSWADWETAGKFRHSRYEHWSSKGTTQTSFGWRTSSFECLLGASLKPSWVFLASLRRAKHLPLVCKECPCLYLESLCLVPLLLTEDFTQRPSGGGRDSARELLSAHTLACTFTYPSLSTNTHII